MPIVQSNFKTAFGLKNGHINTILPNLFRLGNLVKYKRERIETIDGDFIDIDTSLVSSKTAVIILHGLEGSSTRPYMQGIASMANQQGWDAFAVNHRGCSGEQNRLISTYHSGKTEDLHWVVEHIIAKNKYDSILIVGFSLGGNMVLKYAGEDEFTKSNIIKAYAAVSVPCCLAGAAKQLANGFNFVYMKRFMKSLKQKVLDKKEQFPNSFIDVDAVAMAKTFADFDDLYTAPAHGFKSADDYWEKCSSKQFLSTINQPTLLINALDDTFLDDGSYPYNEAKENSTLFLETPKFGGHVGFAHSFLMRKFYHEHRIRDFFNNVIK